jgi:hypothetical protein
VLLGPLRPTLTHSLPHRKGYEATRRPWPPPQSRSLQVSRSWSGSPCPTAALRTPFCPTSAEAAEGVSFSATSEVRARLVGRPTTGSKCIACHGDGTLPCAFPRYAHRGWRVDQTLPTQGGGEEQARRSSRAGLLRRGARSSRSRSHGASQAGIRHALRVRWWPPRRRRKRARARPRRFSRAPDRT